ncbi:MAG: DUF1772 domain-containing protein [Kiloniellales bacterium]
MPTLLLTVTVLAALGCGTMAGLFFAFSVFVMKALGARPAAEGIAAMQAINVKILTPRFFLLFFGSAALCVVLAIAALLDLSAQGALYALLGGLLYLAGCIGVTMVFNVPLNNALAAADPASEAGAAFWGRYLSVWTAWNHLRTLACLAAAALLIFAAVAQPAALDGL